jgi:hypothetical protein
MVTLRYPAESVTVHIDLVSGHGRWRIADIYTKSVPSLAGFLEASARRKDAEAKRGH